MLRRSLTCTGLLLTAVPAFAVAASFGGHERADRLTGTAGPDVMRGRGGADYLDGRSGADLLDGGPGNDRLIADGRDRVFGRGGNDSILVVTRNGRLRVDCGKGRDRLTIRTGRTISRTALRRRTKACELVRVKRLAATDPGGFGAGAAPGAAPGAPNSAVTPGATAGTGSGPAPGAPRPTPTQPAEPEAPPTLFVSTTGSDTNSCRVGAPCQSFARAYQAAASGETVEVAGGTYPGQVIDKDSSKTSTQDVVFRPADGAAVVLTDYITLGSNKNAFGGSHLMFRDMKIQGLLTWRMEDVTLRNVDMEAFFLQGARGVRIIGGSIGGTADGTHSDIKIWNGEIPTDVLIDGVDFHDVQAGSSTDHMECLQVQEATNITLRNSRFHNCDTFDARWDAVTNALVENNVFESAQENLGIKTYYSLSMRAGVNVVIRNNSSTQPWAGPSGSDSPVQDFTFANNIFGRIYVCDDRVQFRNNIWIAGEKCDPSDRTPASAGLIDAPGGNFRLAPGSPAIDAGWTGGFPATDFLGSRRPQGASPDIGAFESG